MAVYFPGDLELSKKYFGVWAFFEGIIDLGLCDLEVSQRDNHNVVLR